MSRYWLPSQTLDTTNVWFWAQNDISSALIDLRFQDHPFEDELYSRWKLTSRQCIIQAMLVKLAEFMKLQLALQTEVDELTVEAEGHPEAPTALAHLKVAAKIKELDRQIEVLNRRLSKDTRADARDDTSPSSATAKTINFLVYTS